VHLIKVATPERTVTLVIHGIHCGMSDLFVHMSNASVSGTPLASTRALEPNSNTTSVSRYSLGTNGHEAA
jgi:hypothetical protein